MMTESTIPQEIYNSMFLDELQDIAHSNIEAQEKIVELANSMAMCETLLYYLLGIGLVIVLYGMFKFVSNFLNMFF